MLEEDLYINILEFSFVLLLSYLIGSIPSGLIISKIFNKVDPRVSGSKNIGATNILRLSGWKLGLTTLILDMFKGFLALFIFSNSSYLGLAILFVFLGHLYSFLLKFNGGKGVAVFLGTLFNYDIFLALTFIITWLSVAFIFRYSSLSAIVSSLVVLVLFYIRNDEQIWIFSCIVLLILYKHVTNISRLINGNESQINFKNKN